MPFNLDEIDLIEFFGTPPVVDELFASTYESRADSGLRVLVTLGTIDAFVLVRVLQHDVEVAMACSERVTFVRIDDAARRIHFTVDSAEYHGYVLVGVAPDIFVHAMTLPGAAVNAPGR